MSVWSVDLAGVFEAPGPPATRSPSRADRTSSGRVASTWRSVSAATSARTSPAKRVNVDSGREEDAFVAEVGLGVRDEPGGPAQMGRGRAEVHPERSALVRPERRHAEVVPELGLVLEDRAVARRVPAGELDGPPLVGTELPRHVAEDLGTTSNGRCCGSRPVSR